METIGIHVGERRVLPEGQKGQLGRAGIACRRELQRTLVREESRGRDESCPCTVSDDESDSCLLQGLSWSHAFLLAAHAVQAELILFLFPAPLYSILPNLDLFVRPHIHLCTFLRDRRFIYPAGRFQGCSSKTQKNQKTHKSSGMQL